MSSFVEVPVVGHDNNEPVLAVFLRSLADGVREPGNVSIDPGQG